MIVEITSTILLISFFASHTLTQLAIWQHTAVAMANISDAVGAVARKDYAGASSLAQGAVREIEALLAAERRGEAGDPAPTGRQPSPWPYP